MTRPKKIGLDYFPVDVKFDQKIEAIELIHKNDGLVWIIKFWQEAYQTETGEVDLSGLFGELFANKCRITSECHQKILSTCIQVGFCEKTETGLYTSNGIKKRISSVSKERLDAIQRKEDKKSIVKDCLCSSENNDNNSENNKNTNIIVIDQVLAYLNEKTGSHFRTDTSHYISGRLKDGYTINDIMKVIDRKVSQWLGDQAMCIYLRPKTLFAPSHFEEYLNEPKQQAPNKAWKFK
jgi:uncharacterized phage protein (TIGR02220 family)